MSPPDDWFEYNQKKIRDDALWKAAQPLDWAARNLGGDAKEEASFSWGTPAPSPQGTFGPSSYSGATGGGDTVLVLAGIFA